MLLWRTLYHNRLINESLRVQGLGDQLQLLSSIRMGLAEKEVQQKSRQNENGVPSLSLDYKGILLKLEIKGRGYFCPQLKEMPLMEMTIYVLSNKSRMWSQANDQSHLLTCVGIHPGRLSRHHQLN